ncbi:hypothetical protein [Hymenobacter terrenus]|uniref:hypothetical protein n=1 Tax=Hymenobacter terrenus TaxID=1629124 RepID=UPI0006194288|nr:hypothetical protein [Hymenobacter terrenus]
MNIQLFAIAQYARLYLSPLLRGDRLISFLSSLLAPLQFWRDQRTNTVYPDLERRARYNAQVARFERALNTLFNVTTTPGIYIDDSASRNRTYLYRTIEEQPLYVYTAAENVDDPSTILYLFSAPEYFPVYDFVVHVPMALYNSQLPRLNSLIRKYKLAGTTYSIVGY